MRLTTLTVTLFSLLFSISPASGAEEEVQKQVIITPELVEAQHALQQARFQVRNYQYVKLPTIRRTLDEQIRLAETEIRFLRRRLRDYRPFLRVGEYSPVRTAAESHALSLETAHQRLRQLQDDRITLMRTTRQQFTLYHLEVLHAATRLEEIRRELATEPE